MSNSYQKSVLTFLFISLFLRASGTNIPDYQDSIGVNELLLYSVPSYRPLDWKSPSSLLKSTLNSFVLSKCTKKTYSVGHMIIVINTPMADSSVRMAMKSTSNSEKIRLFIKDGVGLGILAAPMRGRLETSNEISEFLAYYQKSNKRISFLRYILNDKSTERVLKFLSIFSGQEDPSYQPYKLYGGDYWPRYENEGAGCSAFAIATLEVAGIYIDNPEWYVSVIIPGKIVGGKFNNGKKVKTVDIEYSKHWDSGEGTANLDYFHYKVYDPSKLYDWIQRLFSKPSNGYQPFSIGRITGITYDARDIIPNMEEPIIIKRKEPSVFVNKNIIVPLRP